VLEKNGCYALVQGTNDPRMTWGTWTGRYMKEDKLVFQ
jgi:hypothetical protein